MCIQSIRSLHSFIKISEHRLHYLDEGEGTGRCHGAWQSHLVILFSQGNQPVGSDHRVIALIIWVADCRTSPRIPYTLAQHISNLETLLESLADRALFPDGPRLGRGNWHGLRRASPDQIDKIVVMNTAAFRSTRIPLRIRICRWPVLGALLVRGLEWFCPGRQHIWPLSDPCPQEVAKAYIAPYNTWQNRVAIHQFVRDIPLDDRHVSYPRSR